MFSLTTQRNSRKSMDNIYTCDIRLSTLMKIFKLLTNNHKFVYLPQQSHLDHLQPKVCRTYSTQYNLQVNRPRIVRYAATPEITYRQKDFAIRKLLNVNRHFAIVETQYTSIQTTGCKLHKIFTYLRILHVSVVSFLCCQTNMKMKERENKQRIKDKLGHC